MEIRPGQERTNVSDIARYVSKDAAFTAPVRDILVQCGHATDALLYYTLFFPEFIEIDGSILLKENIDDVTQRFQVAKLKSKLSLAGLEASFNLVEVAYLFRSDNDLDESVEIKLCHLLKESWSLKLRYEYPHRVFSVSVVSPEDSGSVYCVQFFEVR
jgi:hypothetical protein